MKLLSSSQIKQVEDEANGNGYSYQQMMENAGLRVAEVIRKAFAFSERKSILGLVGSGNNGGDTLIALRRLAQWGWNTSAYLTRPRSKDDLPLADYSEKGGSVFQDDPGQLAALLQSAEVVLDGVFGTGFKGAMKPEASELFGAVERTIQPLYPRPRIVAVDCPSGVNCDTGEVAEGTLRADLTICIGACKTGLLKLPAYQYAGDIHFVDIGFEKYSPTFRSADIDVVTAHEVAQMMPVRPFDAHKGTFGTTLIVAGSTNYTGAALLAGKAAYYSGTGLVTLAVPNPLHPMLAGHLPEATWVLLPHELGAISQDGVQVLKDSLRNTDAMLIGPGLGMENPTLEFVRRFLNIDMAGRHGAIGFVKENQQPDGPEGTLPPLVIDADGLKLMAKVPDWYKSLPANSILTPHPGEMAVLTGLPKEVIQQDRSGVARKFAKLWGQVVVLKGAFTVIANSDGEVATIPFASPALSKAGSGDILAGIIAGLLAQKVAPFDAAKAGAWLHARSGMLAKDQIGNTFTFLISDILQFLPDVIEELGVQ